MMSRNREIDLQHRYSLHSKTSLWILQMTASHSVFLGWGTSISPHETEQYHTVMLSCDVETMYSTADTLLWADLIRNIPWGAWRCDGLHHKDCGKMCPVGCSHCHRFIPSQVAKGFGGYCLSFPQHFFLAPQGYFWKACGGKRISEENQHAPSTSLLFLQCKDCVCTGHCICYKGICKWRDRDELNTRTCLF